MRLPAEYQELEWIQSSGTQYINTGLSSNGSYFKTEYKFQLLSTSSDDSNAVPFIFGSSNNGRLYQTIDTSKTQFQFGAGSTDILPLNISINTDYEIKAEWNSGILSTKINGSTSTNSYNGSLSTRVLPIFCRYSSYYHYYAKIKLYYFKMYTASNTLARDFIPCYRKSDGVAGLYDLVGNTFYTNSGSGTFIKGPAVNNKVKKVHIGTKLIRPKWEPNENTYLYYPLTSDLKDVMGNGANGTNNGGCTFDKDTGVRVIGASSKYITGLTNGTANRNKFTLCVRAKYTSTRELQYILGYGCNYASCEGFNICLYNSYIRGMVASGSSEKRTDLVYKDTNWHNIVCVGNGNGKYHRYCDGKLKGTQSMGALNNISTLQIGRGGNYGSGRTGDGYLKDYIVELIPRTYEQVKDYYDSTKALYGINN